MLTRKLPPMADFQYRIITIVISRFQVNRGTNKIYVANYANNTVTVIDGVTLQMSTMASPGGPEGIAVNPVTNKIYVSNLLGTVTVIDGATLSTRTVVGGGCPWIAVNTVTNKIYAPTTGNTVSR